MLQIPRYSAKVIEYIEAFQRQKLSSLYGPLFEESLHKIFPKDEEFLNHIEKELEKEFKDNFDECFEFEAKLKNSVI